MIERYKPACYSKDYFGVESDKNGDYVKYDDYKKIEEENEKLKWKLDIHSNKGSINIPTDTYKYSSPDELTEEKLENYIKINGNIIELTEENKKLIEIETLKFELNKKLINFRNKSECECSIYYNSDSNEFEILTIHQYSNFYGIYFKTKEIAENALCEFRKDFNKIKEYYKHK